MVMKSGDTCNRVIFYVRCHGLPDEDIEHEVMEKIRDAVTVPEAGWGILTIGRSYYHDKGSCHGHPDANDPCNEPPIHGGGSSV